jgi:hypothetical protein
MLWLQTLAIVDFDVVLEIPGDEGVLEVLKPPDIKTGMGASGSWEICKPGCLPKPHSLHK